MTRMDFGHRGEDASDTRAMAEADQVGADGRGPRGVLVAIIAIVVIAVVIWVIR